MKRHLSSPRKKLPSRELRSTSGTNIDKTSYSTEDSVSPVKKDNALLRRFQVSPTNEKTSRSRFSISDNSLPLETNLDDLKNINMSVNSDIEPRLQNLSETCNRRKKGKNILKKANPTTSVSETIESVIKQYEECGPHVKRRKKEPPEKRSVKIGRGRTKSNADCNATVDASINEIQSTPLVYDTISGTLHNLDSDCEVPHNIRLEQGKSRNSDIGPEADTLNLSNDHSLSTNDSLENDLTKDIPTYSLDKRKSKIKSSGKKNIRIKRNLTLKGSSDKIVPLHSIDNTLLEYFDNEESDGLVDTNGNKNASKILIHTITTANSKQTSLQHKNINKVLDSGIDKQCDASVGSNGMKNVHNVRKLTSKSTISDNEIPQLSTGANKATKVSYNSSGTNSSSSTPKSSVSNGLSTQDNDTVLDNKQNKTSASNIMAFPTDCNSQSPITANISKVSGNSSGTTSRSSLTPKSTSSNRSYSKDDDKVLDNKQRKTSVSNITPLITGSTTTDCSSPLPIKANISEVSGNFNRTKSISSLTPKSTSSNGSSSKDNDKLLDNKQSKTNVSNVLPLTTDCNSQLSVTANISEISGNSSVTKRRSSLTRKSTSSNRSSSKDHYKVLDKKQRKTNVSNIMPLTTDCNSQLPIGANILEVSDNSSGMKSRSLTTISTTSTNESSSKDDGKDNKKTSTFGVKKNVRNTRSLTSKNTTMGSYPQSPSKNNSSKGENAVKPNKTFHIPFGGALPVIKISNGTDNFENRQVGFKPITNLEQISNKNIDSSICGSSTTVCEDFTDCITEFPLYWTEEYNFDDDTFKVSSKDCVFKGALVENDIFGSFSDLSSVHSSPRTTSSHDSEPRLSLISKSLRRKLAMEINADNSDIHKNLQAPENTPDDADSARPRQRVIFKVPVLPAAKRPPGRTKSNTSLCTNSSDSSDSGFLLHLDNLGTYTLPQSTISSHKETEEELDYDCDAISMFAESIYSETEGVVEKRDNNAPRHNSPIKRINITFGEAGNTLKKVSPEVQRCQSPHFKNDENIVLTSCPDINGSNDVVENSAKPVHIEKTLEKTGIATAPPAKNTNENVAQWTSTGHYPHSEKIDWSKVPLVFKRLCYYHYTFGCKYTYNTCKRWHHVGRQVLRQLESLSCDNLIEAYNFAKDRHRLFQETFIVFLSSFKLYPKFELLNLIEDVLSIIEGDKYPYVSDIICAEESRGQVFKDIVLEIMFREGNKNSTMVGILMEIVCSRKDDFVQHWPLIKFLFKYNSDDDIVSKLIQDIMQYCIYTENRALSQNLVTDIITATTIILAIRIPILNRFYMLLRSLHLQKEAEMFKLKMRSFNIYLETSETDRIPFSLNSEPNLNDPNPGATYESFNCSQSNALNSTNLQNSNFSNEQNYLPNYKPNMQNTSLMNFNDKIPENLTLGHIDSVGTYRSGQPKQSLLAFTSSCSKSNQFQDNSFFPTQSPSDQCNGSYNISSKSTSPFDFNITNYEFPENSPNFSIPSSNRTQLNIPVQTQILSNSSDQLGINEKQIPAHEVKLLQDIIKRGSNEEFTIMLRKYLKTAYCRSFIINTLCLFKNSNNAQKTCAMFSHVAQELIPEAMKDSALLQVLRVLCVNIIAILDSQNAFDEAADILVIFMDDLHNLTKSEWLSVHKYSYSSFGKYIFFCKILTKGGHYKHAFNLFMNSDINILQGSEHWKIQHSRDFDVPFRNDIVLEFINLTLKNDLLVAMNMLLYFLMNKECISEIAAHRYYNSLICRMVDGKTQYLEELKSMVPKIVDGWHVYLTPLVLRGLLVVLVPHCPFSIIESLYAKCFNLGVYPKITGNELNIPLQTYLTCEEIYAIFKIYLSKMIKHKSPVTDLVFDIVANTASNEPQVIRNATDLVRQLKLRICTVLAKSFHHTINLPPNNEELSIKIPRDQMRTFLNEYTKAGCSDKS